MWGKEKGEQKEMSHVFHVERAAGNVDLEAQRVYSSMFTPVCFNVLLLGACLCVFFYQKGICFMKAVIFCLSSLFVRNLEEEKKSSIRGEQTGTVVCNN